MTPESDDEHDVYQNMYADVDDAHVLRDLRERKHSKASMFSGLGSALGRGIGKSVSNFMLLDTDGEIAARMQYGTDTSFKSRLQQYFVENHRSSLRIRMFNLIIKLISCVLYCVRVIHDKGDLPDHVKPEKHEEGDIKYEYLVWVDRSDLLWLMQTIVAIISIAETLIIFFITYKGSIVRLLFNVHFLLEMITSFPYVVTIFMPKCRQLFVPAFLNCWLAISALQDMMHDLNRTSALNQSALFRQMVILLSILISLIFTGMCGIEHLQRGGERQFDLFTSFYFVMVTFSTVGYGDWYPDTWMSRLLVVALICIAFVVLPQQIEALGQTWMERQKSGGDYAHWSDTEKHVVVTITHLEVEFIKDFLTEFYAHSQNARMLIVLLTPSELDNQTRMLLKVPLWHSRVHYVRGSALKDEDLERAKMATAKACFILSARHVNRKLLTDEHTILRSWAVKDFAPNVPQYVQVFRPETKMHIDHAEVLICEDEFKYSILSNNCICPGISTFITLLIHTSRGEEGQKSTEPWHKVYGFHSGNEIYDIVVNESKFFGDFVGKSFTYASFHAHRSYGVGLLAVRRAGMGAKIQLNPGISHIIEPSDTLYYMGLTNEESLYDFRRDLKNQQKKANVASSIANVGNVVIDVPQLDNEKKEKQLKKKKRSANSKGKDNDEVCLINVSQPQSSRRPSIAMVTEAQPDSSSSDSADEETCERCGEGKECIQNRVHRRYPQVRTYIGTSPTVCHMLRQKRDICCLQLDQACEHCPHSAAHEYKWTLPPIIVAADRTSSGMYNMIIPLRAYYRPVHELHPIVLLLELEENATPNPAFLDAISYFPEIYWMQGKISNLDNLLKAGVCQAEHVVVVKEAATLGEEHFADCSTIITVQKIHRMFPNLRMITELTHASNMRFVQFNPHDPYSLQQSKFEKKERKRGSNMPFMFRLPFAQGGVFSANMVDRLLYQSFIKPYVVDFTRLLLGVDQSAGSGYLTSFVITEDDLWIRNYGRLYQKLASSVADIPLGIFRTKRMDAHTVSLDMEERCRAIDLETQRGNRKKEMNDMVLNRMKNLGIKANAQNIDNMSDARDCMISYVIINPSSDLVLEAGDIVYVLRGPVKETARNKKINPRRGLERTRNVDTMDMEVVENPASKKNSSVSPLVTPNPGGRREIPKLIVT